MVESESGIWYALTTVVGIVLSVVAWAYKILSDKIVKIETFTMTRLSEPQIRQIIDDKLDPLEVEYRSLSFRIDDVRTSQRNLEAQLQRIIELMHER